MTIRTEEEIGRELARLVVLKPTVIEFNAFGDSNHRSIQACIDVLMYDYSRIEIVQRHGDDENALLHSMLTRAWLDGIESEPPSEWGWPLKPQPAIHTHTDCLLDR